MSDALRFLAPLLHPDLSPAYLRLLLAPLAETLALTLATLALAAPLGLSLAIVVAARLPGGRMVGLALTLLRAVPDLTLAVLAVILFGLGTGAALAALVLFYTAAIGRIFADLMGTVREAPLAALSAAGAGRLQLALFGRLPLAGRDLMGYGLFAFECALRSSIVVGAVGGGGIGGELVGALAGFDFAHAATQILLLMAVIALLDAGAARLLALARPLPVLLALLTLGLLAAWQCAPTFVAAGHALAVARDMLPPTLDRAALARLPHLVVETLAITLAGTFAAGALGLLLALAAARRTAPPLVGLPVRRLLDLLRTVPELVWALLLVAVTGVGPVAGAWALGLHSLGSLGRLYADALDNVPETPRAALAQAGAGRLLATLYAAVPLARGRLAAHLLFRLEWNLRMATVLGVIGAGGIGQALYEAQQLFFYRQVAAYVLVTAAVILATDRASAAIRRRLRLPGRRAAAADAAPAF